MGTFRYRAFISYSHRDEAWSAWLQRALEHYRIPARLIERTGGQGDRLRRLSPVFRDREDLSSAADLGATVKTALEGSEALIVICSPAAAKSRWVNEEIRYFRSLGRGDRIFALIVDGDPLSDDPDRQCFPPALLHQQEDGTEREPLAADARKHADGRLLAKLKIIAGILGVPLDDLRRRDLQRRQRLWMVSMGGALTVALAMAVLAVMAITARNTAENRREHAEELVGYMVGDLKTKLDEVGRLDILEGMGGRVSEYLKSLDPSEVTDESLTQQAKVWRQLGEVAMDQGALPKALQAFTTSRDVLGELARRNPESAQYVYELGNAEFWVGYVHTETGDFDAAQSAFDAYLAYANRLGGMEPENPEWLMEQSYAQSNLAALINRRGDGRAAEALAHIQKAVDFNRQALELAPDNADYLSEYGEVMAWLADTQLLTCDLGGAFRSRQENVKIARSQMDHKPGDVNLKRRYAYALTGLSSVAQQAGMIDFAIGKTTESRDVLGQLSVIEPTNLDFRFEYLRRELFIATLLAESGKLAEALSRMQAIEKPFRKVLDIESNANLRRYTNWIDYQLAWADAAARAGDDPAAQQHLDSAIAGLSSLLQNGTDTGAYMDLLMRARFLLWQQRGNDLLETAPFSGVVPEPGNGDTSCADRANLVAQAILDGNEALAQEETNELLGKGYYEPAFVRMCRQYALCPGHE